ncbi:hypothetical protein BC830DRAFT_1168377 [Chytriomyces sp. MP71]|nr:hypothetical protein BC830DRAFT_1168377 [Chytriomyces sp. MP71]
MFRGVSTLRTAFRCLSSGPPPPSPRAKGAFARVLAQSNASNRGSNALSKDAFLAQELSASLNLSAKSVSLLVYKGPVSDFVANARILSWLNFGAHAVVVPLVWHQFVLPASVLATMFTTTALVPVLAIGAFSVSYVTRLWIITNPAPNAHATKRQAKDVPERLRFETLSFFKGDAVVRDVAVRDLRTTSKWIFGTWRVHGDGWLKPSLTVDRAAISSDPVLSRIHDQVKEQSESQHLP